jgi:penicillin-binding protein 1A
MNTEVLSGKGGWIVMSDKSMHSRISKRKKSKNGWKKVLRIILLSLLSLMLATGLVLTLYLAAVLGSLDDFDPEQLERYQQTSFFYDHQGNIITNLHGTENRIKISLNDIPRHVQDAFVSVEDVRFFEHPGFDIRRMFGSLIANIKARALVQGAGTITQQVIRNTVLTQEKTWERKLKEIYLAYIIEQRYSKEQILEMYLNLVYFGKAAYGIEAASKTYFGKSSKDLTLAEGALLAGILRNPLRYSPFLDKEKSLERKNLALSLMEKYGKITPKQAEEAKQEKIQFAEDVKPALPHGFIIDMAMEEAADLLDISEEELYTGGYMIYTTVDSRLQEYAEELFAQNDLFPNSPATGESCEGALVVLDTATGEIRALMGGRRYPENQRKVMNRAKSRRQPGSAIKPLVVYGPALESRRYTAATFIEDAPVTYGNYTPKNYGGSFSGMVSLRTALAKSINIPAVKVLRDIGIKQGIAFAEKLGITFTESDRNNLSIALGGMEKGISPLEMARAYSTFGDRGSYKKYTIINRIEDYSGRILYEYRPVKEQALSEEIAFILSSILQSAARKGGTASRLASLPFPLCAKTGTVELPNIPAYAGVNGTGDLWSAVYNPEYTITVWMGFDRHGEGLYLPSKATGGTYPTEMAKRLFAHIYEEKAPPEPIRKPLGVTVVRLDGMALWNEFRVVQASPLTPDNYVQTEYFTTDTVPHETSDYWSIPRTPMDFTVGLGDNNLPVIRFTPRDTFAVYDIYRLKASEGVAKETADVIHRIQTGSLEPVQWTDPTAKPGVEYGYFIIPVHVELILSGETAQGSATPIHYVRIPQAEDPAELDNDNDDDSNDDGLDFWDFFP